MKNAILYSVTMPDNLGEYLKLMGATSIMARKPTDTELYTIGIYEDLEHGLCRFMDHGYSFIFRHYFKKISTKLITQLTKEWELSQKEKPSKSDIQEQKLKFTDEILKNTKAEYKDINVFYNSRYKKIIIDTVSLNIADEIALRLLKVGISCKSSYIYSSVDFTSFVMRQLNDHLDDSTKQNGIEVLNDISIKAGNERITMSNVSLSYPSLNYKMIEDLIDGCCGDITKVTVNFMNQIEFSLNDKLCLTKIKFIDFDYFNTNIVCEAFDSIFDLMGFNQNGNT